MSDSQETPGLQLPDFSDAEMARVFMGQAQHVCAAIGVTVQFNVQIVDATARSPETLLREVRKLNMVCTHLISREKLSEEYIRSILVPSTKSETE